MDAAMRLKDVCKRIGLSRATVYLLLEQGKFPAPFQIGKRAIAWLESEIDEWLMERSKTRVIRFKSSMTDKPIKPVVIGTKSKMEGARNTGLRLRSK